MSQPSALKVIAIIPARLGSTRLPRKVLLPLAGKPLLAWVVEAACRCPQLGQVIVATDSEEVISLGQSRGWEMRLTSSTLVSGSDRVHAVASQMQADIFVNIQGDEPTLQPEHITALLRPFARATGSQVDVTTLSTDCSEEDLHNPNAVKVVCAADGRALYFSRATIPFDRDGTGGIRYRKHLGFYAYRRAALQRFAALPPGPLELTEKLEQLRLLEHGLSIYVEHVALETIGVDTPEDLARAEAWLRTKNTASLPA